MSEPKPEDNVHPEAKSIVESFKEPIIEYHKLSKKKVKSVHDLLNTIALQNGKPPMDPRAVAFLLDLTEEQCKAPAEGGLECTEEQILGCFAKLVPKGDTPEVFGEKVINHVREAVKRMTYADKVFPDIEPLLKGFHEKVDGDSEKLYKWFLDLLPEEAKENAEESFPKQYFMGMVMATAPDKDKIELDSFLAGIKSNMDEGDTVEKMQTAIDKHA